MPAFHGHYGLAHKLEFVGEKKKARFARTALPRGIKYHQVDLFCSGLVTRLDLVLPALADQEAVLLKILPDYAFIDG